MYHSLNEGSLEGYLRTFAREGNLLGKHYFKYGLMRDEQRRDLLLGLLASIQDISFDLALVLFLLAGVKLEKFIGFEIFPAIVRFNAEFH